MHSGVNAEGALTIAYRPRDLAQRASAQPGAIIRKNRRHAPARDSSLIVGHHPARKVTVNRFSHITAAIIVGIGMSPVAVGQVPSTRTDEDQITAVIKATTDAFNQRDPRAWLQVATPGAELITGHGEVMRGAAEIEKGLTALFKGRNRQASVKTLDISPRVIRPDVALVYVTNEISGVIDASGQTEPPSRELSLRILVKDEGVWRMTALMIQKECPPRR